MIAQLSSLSDILNRGFGQKANIIATDTGNKEFKLLPSGQRYGLPRPRWTRFKHLFLERAMNLLDLQSRNTFSPFALTKKNLIVLVVVVIVFHWFTGSYWLVLPDVYRFILTVLLFFFIMIPLDSSWIISLLSSYDLSSLSFIDGWVWSGGSVFATLQSQISHVIQIMFQKHLIEWLVSWKKPFRWRSSPYGTGPGQTICSKPPPSCVTSWLPKNQDGVWELLIFNDCFLLWRHSLIVHTLDVVDYKCEVTSNRNS